MYHPDLIAEDEAECADQFRAVFPSGLPWYSVDDAAALTASAMEARDEHDQPTRPLTEDEQQFIGSTKLRVIYDFPYFAERFCWVDDGGHGLRRLTPLWESQRMILEQLGRIEMERVTTGSPDGLLLNVLKARQLGACLVPDTRVLTADLRWIAIGDLDVGDTLIAVDEFPPGGRGDGRELRTTVVEATRTLREDAYELTFDTGVRVIATGPHRWLTRNRGGTETRWRTVEKMQVDDVVRYVTTPWGLGDVEDGWVGGMLDGEGSLAAARAGVEVSISQRYGPVYNRVADYLTARGYASFHHERADTRTPETSSKFGREPVGKISVARIDEVFHLLGQTRPTRFIGREWWAGKELPGKRNGFGWARVVAITPVGPRDVVDLQTSAKTFLAEGLVSHNSTFCEALVAHRLVTRPHIRGLSGADVEDQAGYLFRMVVRLYEQLPWFLRPGRVYFTKNRELTLANQSTLKTAWGKSTRGALTSNTGVEGNKGSIGRGQTFSVVHISELPTWENPEQLDTALLPAIPYAPDTLVLYEATAEFAGDWWHQHWLASGAGEGRFSNVFIPWSAEPSKYSLPAPEGWGPSASTLAHAAKAERDSPKWYGGLTVRLSREQLYWYETTRRFYESKGLLYKFLKEYPADDHECFQYSGRSVFTLEQLEAIDRAGSLRPLKDVWVVEPALDIAKLRREALAPSDAEDLVAGVSLLASPDIQPKRPIPPLAPHTLPRGTALQHETNPVPPGYGFRRLDKSQLSQLPNLRHSVLAIWEYPRLRGNRRYVMAIDVSDGLGQDYSVIDIIRQPTIEEPAEQVAQYCTNKLDPKALAFVADAIGRYYLDADQIEAMAAIETNNHGLATQDTLQLHLGYSHFYRWEYADAADPVRRYSTRIGWMTSPRTRPLLLASYYGAITTVDPVSTLPDLVLNSPITRGELRHFITASTIGEAEAARGQHDDAVMASAIGYYVAWRMSGGEIEPVAERRRRKAALDTLNLEKGTIRPDYRNSPATVEEADDLEIEDGETVRDDVYTLDDAGQEGIYFDDRTRA